MIDNYSYNVQWDGMLVVLVNVTDQEGLREDRASSWEIRLISSGCMPPRMRWFGPRLNRAHHSILTKRGSIAEMKGE